MVCSSTLPTIPLKEYYSSTTIYNSIKSSAITLQQLMHLPHRHRLGTPSTLVQIDSRYTTNDKFHFILLATAGGARIRINIAMAQVLFIIPNSIRTSAYQPGVWILYSRPQIARSHHSAHRYPLLFILRPRHCWTSLRRGVCGM